MGAPTTYADAALAVRRARALPSAPSRTAAAAAEPHLYVVVLTAWLASVAWFHPRLWSLLQMARSPVEWLALAFFVVFTEFAWLYGFYNVGVVLFAALHNRRNRTLEATALPVRPPAVALLYTTCNDFVEKSAESCLAQDYPNFTLYILDDSNRRGFQRRVDRFAALHPERVRVVRRSDRAGFKAGNINHGLRSAAVTEPVFALADSDELLPPNFLRRTVSLLLAKQRRGFVQAAHRANPNSPSPLARDLGIGVDIHWRWYQPLRNRYGFVMLLGHGAVIRRECWQEVGGFPEIVSEDLAFAIRARDRGWRGHFAEDVVCLEEFPDSVRAFRVRHMKWTRGTWELLSSELRGLLTSRNIPLVEKLDVLFPTANLALSLVYFLFVVDANLVLALLFGVSEPVTVAAGGLEFVFPVWHLSEGFGAIRGLDFFLITLVTLIAPVLCFVIELLPRPLLLFRFLARSTALYGALAPLSCAGSLGYLATGRAVFHVTADRLRAAAARGSKLERLRTRWRRLLVESHPDSHGVQAFEVACGAACALLSIKLWQVSFFGVALANLMLPVLHYARWDHPAMRWLTLVPLTFLLGGIVLGGMSVAGLPTALFGYGFHF